MAQINPFRYRGYYFDTETGFYYLQSRYYDPQIGRFINADQFASTGQDFIGYNMFAYCNNNPVMYADPEGTVLIGAIVGGAIGGALVSVISHLTTNPQATVASTLTALAVGAVTGALGGWAGMLKTGKVVVSAVSGAIAGIYAGISTEGDWHQKVATGFTTGLITAVATFAGAHIDTLGSDRFGTAVANYTTTVLMGFFTEPIAVATQQKISNSSQQSSYGPSRHHVSLSISKREVSLMY